MNSASDRPAATTKDASGHDPMIALEEASIKGYIKFDIILQSEGDKVKIHYEDNNIDDEDELEK